MLMSIEDKNIFESKAKNGAKEWSDETRNLFSFIVKIGADLQSRVKKYEKYWTGINAEYKNIKREIWLIKNNEAYVKRFFVCHKLNSHKTIIMFVGSLKDHRLYSNHGKIYSEIRKSINLNIEIPACKYLKQLILFHINKIRKIK